MAQRKLILFKSTLPMIRDKYIVKKIHNSVEFDVGASLDKEYVSELIEMEDWNVVIEAEK